MIFNLKIMKKKFAKVIFSIITILVFTGCDKENLADNYEITNVLPPYIEFRSLETQNVVKGNNATFVFQSRSGFQKSTTITYSISGVINSPNQTVILNRNTLSVNGSLPIPATTATGIATVTLNSAVTEDGKQLTLGANNIRAGQKFNINVTAP